jgi:hypothetical protein
VSTIKLPLPPGQILIFDYIKGELRVGPWMTGRFL